ncbi:ABC transporter ATP-binding protein [Candidatus Woesearchaeota archaeon]|nr:ABC transporter ATP-binding protein [Candidatus Woesearchaeota archaeon]
MARPIVLEIKNLRKQFKKNVVLNNINIDISRGEIFGIIGMSGSGKTTLLNCMVGYTLPEEGEVLFQASNIIDRDSKTNHKPITKNILRLRKSFGFAPQLPSFYLELTSEENLYYFASLYGIPRDIRKTNVEHLLKLTGLEKARDTLAGALSGGMKKRLGIACALVHKPEVLILDEPTADLDPILGEQIWKLIRKINDQGTTVIIASHFIEEIESLCDRIGVLHGGTMLSIGSPLKLRDIYTKNDEIHLEVVSGNYSSIIKKLRSKKSLKIDKIKSDNKKLVLYTPKAQETLHFIFHSLGKKEKIISADINRPTLREVFEYLAQSKMEKLALNDLSAIRKPNSENNTNKKKN